MGESSPSKDELREAMEAYRTELVDLIFPVAPGFDSHPPRLSPTEFVQWCEEMMSTQDIPLNEPEQCFA